MSYTPKKYAPEEFADMLYSGIGTLNEWLESDPEKIIRTNKKDMEKLEIMAGLRDMVADLPYIDDDVLEKADETEFMVTLQFWCTTTFAMAYRLQRDLVKELSEIPTNEGEENIAEIRRILSELQEVLLDSAIFKAALSRAALAGDAEFVTKIDFLTPKWNKPADSVDLNDSEKK